MKSKLIRLSSYLARLGHTKESDFINKFAAYSEEDIKQNFEDIYNKLFPQGMSNLNEKDINKAGMIISQALKSMTEDEVLAFESIQEISYALKSLKKEKKKEKRKDVLNKYKELDKEMKNFIIENSLSNEEVNFAYHKRSGHELFDCLRDILRLRNDYLYLKDRMRDLPIIDKVNFKFDDEVIKFQKPELYDDIDKANDAYMRIEQKVGVIESGDAISKQRSELLNYYNYIYNGINKMGIDYDPKLAGKARSDSKIMYNDGYWIIVHSWSEEACQYWERAAVLVHDDGTASFKTCTSRIQNNFYNSYKNYMMFQVIKLKGGALSFFENPYDMFTVCYGPKKEIILGSASVNADDIGIIDEDLRSELPQKVYEALNKITSSEYFEEEVTERKKEFIKDMDSYPSHYRLVEGYEAGYLSDEQFRNYLLLDISSISSSSFFKYMETGIFEKDFMYRGHEYYDVYLRNLYNLHSSDVFFYYDKGLIPEHYFEEHVDVIAMDLSGHSFFSYYKKGLIPEDVYLDHVDNHSEMLNPVTFFENYKKELIPEKTFLNLLSKKAGELLGYGLLQYYKEGLVSEELFLQNIVRASRQADNFFIHTLDAENIVPEQDMATIVNNMVDQLNPLSFLSHLKRGRISEDNIRLYAVEKLKNIYIDTIIEAVTKGYLSNDLFYQVIEEKGEISYYDIMNMINDINLDPEIAKKLFLANAKKARPSSFYSALYDHREIIKPSDFSESLLKEKAKDLDYFQLEIYRDSGIMSDNIYNSILKYFVKDISYFEMLDYVKKGFIHKDFLIYMPYEKLERDVKYFGCYIVIDNLDYIKSLNNGVLHPDYEKVIEEYCKDRL